MKSFTQWLQEAGGMDQLIELLVPDHRKMKLMAHAYARRHHGPRIRARAEELGVRLDPHEIEQVLSHILGPEVGLPKFDIDFYYRHS
jgi:hypothetical protein